MMQICLKSTMSDTLKVEEAARLQRQQCLPLSAARFYIAEVLADGNWFGK